MGVLLCIYFVSGTLALLKRKTASSVPSLTSTLFRHNSECSPYGSRYVHSRLSIIYILYIVGISFRSLVLCPYSHSNILEIDAQTP